MTDSEKKVAEQRLLGRCCAETMVGLGLDALGDDNDQLLDAVAGLCGGMESGMVCGVLTGSACLLSMLDRQHLRETVPELTEWFKENYTEKYGGYTCDEIIKGEHDANIANCTAMMVETYEKCREILAKYGKYI